MYIKKPVSICFRLLEQLDLRACSRARAKTGNRIAARIAIIAITTSSSIRVNPRLVALPSTILVALLCGIVLRQIALRLPGLVVSAQRKLPQFSTGAPECQQVQID